MEIVALASSPRPHAPVDAAACDLLDPDLRASLAVMVVLARSGQPVVSSVLAYRAGVPAGRLDRLVRPLLERGLVQAQRGRSGGYSLARPATSIGLLEILEGVVPALPAGEDLGLGGLGQVLRGFLGSHTVADLLG